MAPPPSPPPPPMDLIEDAIAEILLRLPPDEPEHLFRAAFVCKAWLRILCDPGFLRRYRAFHGAPPLLGLLHIHDLWTGIGDPFPRFVSTTSVPAFPQPAGTHGSFRRILDCRHGRVLVHMVGSPPWDTGDSHHGYLLVWEPVTGDTHALPRPALDLFWMPFFTTAVSCDAQGCNHFDCHGGPFRVAFVAAEVETNTIFASMYTSEAGASSTRTSVSISSTAGLHDVRGAVIGDEVHFALEDSGTFTTVKYDWGKKCLSVMKSPSPLHPEVWDSYYYNFALMAMEDSSLGLAVCVDSSLYIYSRKVNTDGAAQWVRCRVIDLEKVIAKPYHGYQARAVGFAEGVGAILVNSSVGLFIIELKSGQVKKVAEPRAGFEGYISVLPYMSFYTPDRGTLSSLAKLTDVCLATQEQLSKCKTLQNE